MSPRAAVTAAIAGSAAVAAYLDAKLHLRNDVKNLGFAFASKSALNFMAERQAADRLLIYHSLEDQAHKTPNALFLEFEGRKWTYGKFYADVQRVGNWLIKDLGIQKGDMVALDGENSAEYIMLWLSLEASGALVSHINYHLASTPLVHSVKVCKPRVLLAEKGDTVESCVKPHEQELADVGIRTVYYDQALLEALSDTTPLPRERQKGITAQSMKRLIYTSGTTGLPKGVMISAGRELNIARSAGVTLRLKPADKFYTCLPLYHGAAHGLCVTPTIYAGSSMVLGRKFSHKTFWPEVHASGANRLQYVGELCRYLVNAPPHSLERGHKLEEAWGNGLRPDVWEVFRQRFGVPVIHELYAATDGVGATFNRNRGEFSRNAIGVRGLIWHHLNGETEVRAKIDPDTEALLRDKNGFAIRAGVNEEGEVLHRVDPETKFAVFQGYFGNHAASEKRWIENVFEKGDFFFRSGDVQRVDSDGRVYFVDRLGDTFRWRSENVSTNEVSDVVGLFPQIAETNVYGVALPHADGRCGCATIVTQPPTTPETLDLTALTKHVTNSLPRYAVPLFLRVTPALSYTGTFKIQKGQAKREGVDLDLIAKAGSKDQLFWLPPGAPRYVPYKYKDWEALKAGQVRL